LFSPRVEDQSTDGACTLIADISGTERLLGSAETLPASMRVHVAQLGIFASVAVSSNAHTAVCAARGSAFHRKRVLIVHGGEEAAVLSSLPLSVLDLTTEQAEVFALWGIHTLGDVAALPQEGLISRLGQEGKRLWQRARGEYPHLLLPAEQDVSLTERIELDTPVESLDSLLFVLGPMLDQLIGRARSRALALATVSVTCMLDGGALHHTTVRPAVPSGDKASLLKLLHLELSVRPTNAAVVDIELSAEPGGANKLQLGLFSPQLPDASRLDITLARIRAIVGEDRVGVAVLDDAHRPDAFQMEAFVVPHAVPKPRNNDSGLYTAALRLRPPEPVRMTLGDSGPSSLIFRQQQYSIEHAYGPWYASGAWWSHTTWSTEQWDIEACCPAGTPLLCCATHDLTRGTWQIEAIYD
jgi:protein ImuB